MLLVLTALPVQAQDQAKATINLYAAASLREFVSQAVAEFTAENPAQIVAVFGASSSLARQIGAGAPAQLFLSANQEWMDFLDEQGLVAAPSRRDILANQLVLVARGEQAEPLKTLDELPGRLAGSRLAVADPAHVPAGRYAEAALSDAGLWDELKGRLAPALDVRAALNFVAQGATDYGIIYQTDLAAADNLKVVWRFADGDVDIRYPAAVIRQVTGDDNLSGAQALLDWLASDKGQAIAAELGFLAIDGCDRAQC